MQLEIILIKILKKLKLLKFFNFNLSRKYNSIKVKIPFLFGMGTENILINSDWLDTFFKIEDIREGAVIDVGVNIGQTLIKIKTKYPDINYIGFEPNLYCCFYSNNLLEKNNWSNCYIMPYALTDENKLLTFEKTSVSDARASVIKNLRPDFFKIKQTVQGIKYDTIHRDIKISFVKIDVEGGELETIKGMLDSLRKYRPYIVCEVLDSHNAEVLGFTKSRANELKNIVITLSYSIIKLYTDNKKIIQFEEITDFKIKQWTNESLNTNDYFFVPNEKKDLVLKFLNSQL